MSSSEDTDGLCGRRKEILLPIKAPRIDYLSYEWREKIQKCNGISFNLWPIDQTSGEGCKHPLFCLSRYGGNCFLTPGTKDTWDVWSGDCFSIWPRRQIRIGCLRQKNAREICQQTVLFFGNQLVFVFLVRVSQVEVKWRHAWGGLACPLVIMMGESIGGEQCSNLAHLPFSKKSGGEKGPVCGYTACAQYTTYSSAVSNM